MTVRDLSAQARPFQLRIAIVDDDAHVRRALVRLLRVHDVVEFDRARDLLERVVAGERFDVVVSDLMMPDMTGADLHAEFDNVAPDQAARMIVLTGGATTEATQSFLSSKVIPIVFKPFDPADVLALVERVGRTGRASGRVGRNDSR